MAERLNPRCGQYNVEVISRHIERYLTAVKLLNLQPTPSSVALNYGCGDRYTSEVLSCFFNHVVAYDADPTCFGTSDLRITYTDEIPEFQYDAIFLIEVIEHIEKPATLLSDLLQYSDTLLISTPIVPQTNHKPTNPHHRIEYCLKDFVLLLNTAGWHITSADAKQTIFTDKQRATQGIFLAKGKQ